jgi:hypothetical protein
MTSENKFIITGVIIIIIVLVGGFILYNNEIESIKKECNGEIIGKEIGGQNRNIYKCSNGEEILI